MTPANSKATDDSQIRKLMDERSQAVRTKNINGVMSNIAPDVLSFDVVYSLQYSGFEASRKRTQEWFSSFQGSIGYEIRDLRITMSDTIAFCRSLNHISGLKTDGGKIDMWVRVTLCYQKINDIWMITHEHNSIPFDAESSKGSLTSSRNPSSVMGLIR